MKVVATGLFLVVEAPQDMVRVFNCTVLLRESQLKSEIMSKLWIVSSIKNMAFVDVRGGEANVAGSGKRVEDQSNS